MILDTSPVLALLYGEASAQWVADRLAAAPVVQMSTINLTECLIRLRTSDAANADAHIARLTAMPIEFVAPDRTQAELAASARLRFPLNFGDCFAYALAKTQKMPLLTLDRDFRSTDIAVVLPPEP